MQAPVSRFHNKLSAKRLSEANSFNKTDAGNGSKAICRVSSFLRSPSPYPGREAASTRLMKSIVCYLALALTFAAFADDAGFASPNKAFAVVATSDAHRSDCYVIRSTADGRTLATCPDDARYSASPDLVVWSANSSLVAIHTRETRHGGAADIWLLRGGKASQVEATFPDEAGNFYFTPKRWLNATDLECEVIGILDKQRAPDPKNPVKTYTLVMRVDRKARTAKVLKTTKPAYGHFR